jgi:hypothetical protein
MKNIILIILTISVLSCRNNNTKNSEKNNSDTVKKEFKDSASLSLLLSKDNRSKSADSTKYNIEYYKVTIVPHTDGDVGTIIQIYNKLTKKSFSIDEGASYFVSVVDSYILIDNGTTASRGLSIYNLNSSNKIFSVGYEGDLDIKNTLVKFLTSATISDSTKIPKCSGEFNGYVEEQVYDLRTLKLTKTGKFRCWYFE